MVVSTSKILWPVRVKKTVTKCIFGIHVGIEIELPEKQFSLPRTCHSKNEAMVRVTRWSYMSSGDSLVEKCVPKNTATSTKWTVANFDSWWRGWNE